MTKKNAEQYAQDALNLGLLNEQQLQEVWALLGGQNVRVDDFLQTLVRRGILTNYQVDRLKRLKEGNKGGFFFDRYKVLYLVGTGTFSRVYRAVHCDTNEVRALKVLRSRYSDKPDQYIRFVREGKFGCTLRHPNIVRIDDVISHNRTHFFVMEFIEGRNLRDFVRIRKKLHPLEATRLMLDITDALRYAFDHGLTHRDMKMTNVLVSSRGHAKLVDFGLASLDETLNEDDLERLPNVRSIDYAALERATGVRRDDTRSDIYFLGAIYYNMLTGQPPWPETRDRIHRLSKQRFLDVVPAKKVDPSIPNYVASVVNKAMMLDAERRYQNPGLMLSDLESALRRLNELSNAGVETSPDDTQVESGDSSPSLLNLPLLDRTILVVEADGQMQEIFRKGFKKAGARMLLTSDPDRALTRLRQTANAVHGVVINAELLGISAVECFNTLSESQDTASLPAVLLLGENQKKWHSQAKVSEFRRLLYMPITMKQLRDTLVQLIAEKAEKAE
ncbi:MAG: protein kinase domain-containing protein [Thermoguttaceae bacterium]